MRKILITGAKGVLAGKLIEKFRADDEIILIASTRNVQNLPARQYNVQYVNNSDLIKEDILSSVDLIINTAFPRTQSPQILYEAVLFFECLVLKAIDMQVKGFINISSQSVYGSYREMPSFETDDLNPEDVYALTKAANEAIGWALAKDSPLKLVNIRLASLIGIEYPERVINKMIAIAGKDKKLTVQNDKNIFGYMHVDDAAEGIYRFAKNSDIQNWKPIYNFGVKPDYDENLAYIAKIIKKLYAKQGLEIKLEINKQDKADKLQTMNSTWFYEAAQWKPEISLKKTIEMIFQNL